MTGPATVPAAFEWPRPGYRRELFLCVPAISNVSKHILDHIYRKKKNKNK